MPKILKKKNMLFYHFESMDYNNIKLSEEEKNENPILIFLQGFFLCSFIKAALFCRNFNFPAFKANLSDKLGGEASELWLHWEWGHILK